MDPLVAAAGESPERKRKRPDGLRGCGGELTRAAEIVMVLSAMGTMRGGAPPTPAEESLMAEARGRLAAACAALSPKDLFASDAVRVLAEDLGLNCSKDPMVGCRPLKVSIAERLLLTKNKMEESNELAARSSARSSQVLSFNLGRNAEHQATSFQEVPRFLPEKPGPMSSPCGGFQAGTSALAATSPLSSAASSLKYAQAHEVKNSRNPPLKLSGHSSPALLARAEVTHFWLDQRAMLPTNVTHIRANAGGLPEKTSTKPGQPTLVTQTNKTSDNPTLKSDGPHEINTSRTSRREAMKQESKTLVIQAHAPNLLVGNQASGIKYALPQFFPNHTEIAKSVQRIIQHKALDYSNWIPPSTDYVCKPLHCQMCKLVINDAESLLVCDSCEKGTHSKCLQSSNKCDTKLEWHCEKCLNTRNGKPFPPKYGRVTRSTAVSKASSSSGAVQMSMDKKPDSSDLKSDLQTTPNISSGLLVATTGLHGQDSEKSVPDLKIRTGEETPDSTAIPMAIEDEAGKLKQTGENSLNPAPQNENSDKNNENTGFSPSEKHKLTLESSQQPECIAESSSPGCISITASKSINQPLHSCNLQADGNIELPFADGVESAQNEAYKSSMENLDKLSDIHEGSKDEGGCEKTCKRDLGDSLTTHGLALDYRDEAETSRDLSSEETHNVQWVGDILKTMEDKTYYQACFVGGTLYELQNHVLVSFSSQDLVPSKLLTLWEDNKSGSKWAIVNKYLLQCDLSEAMTCPSAPENGEVYATKNERAIMAGEIRGPCEVLDIDHYREEVEKRNHKGDANSSSHSIYLCKWAYDASSGNFQSLTTYPA